ncbi:MAB_1171c family putative transporter [Actinoplanes sp. NPDC051346]|uniref:MAB_1171c family putative transporter n=1 Tax=Actinoplanes sp. NPDC051346 TaxID=3155048 RepID=UPI00341D6FF4
MHDLLYGIGALAGWIAFAYKMNHLRQDWRNPGLRTITAAFGFSALAFTLTVGFVYQPIDSAVGVPNLTKLFIHSSMVLFSMLVLQMLGYWRYPAQRARRRARVYLVLGLTVVAAMSALILVAPIHERYTIHFWKTHAGATAMLAYLTIFLSALSVALVAIAYRAWRFAALTRQLPWLHRGLRITALGAVLSFGYCACRGGFLLLLAVDIRVDPLVDIAMPFATAGQIVFFTGLTMPSWGPRTGIDQLAAYRALEPLWSALHRAFPEIALHSPADGESTLGGVDYRLYRRMVEIWDGQLALRPYRTGEPSSAQEEAEAILDALRRRREGHPATAPAGSHGPAPHGHELEWLVAVSRSFAGLTPARELDRA